MMKYTREQRADMRQQESNSNTASADTQEEDPNDQVGSTHPIFFWREFEEPYGFMCQWFISYFRDQSIYSSHTFNCAEQYMMYRKALVLATPDSTKSDLDIKSEAHGQLRGQTRAMQPDGRRAKISNAQSNPARLPEMILAEQNPGKQKELARSVRFSPAQLKQWDSMKFEVVVQGNYCKFAQNAGLRERLLATGDRELIEASATDNVWGIGFAAEFVEYHREDWGSNLLGKALMTVRERLVKEHQGGERNES